MKTEYRPSKTVFIWKAIKNSDGTIRLQSVYSSTGRSAYVSGTNLILYTLNGTTYNLVDATYEKGAHFVLGTTQIITVSQAYAFLDAFLPSCVNGSVLDSIDSLLDDDPIFDAYFRGDTSQYLVN